MNTNNNNNNNIDSYSFTTEDQIKCYELLQSARMKDFIDVSFVRICHRTVANAFPDVMAECGGFRDTKSDKSTNDTDRLNDIFRLCVRIGLANVIVHFIDEISNDANCVSADAVEARLRDGENVFQCMKGLMEEEKQEMSKTLKSKDGGGDGDISSSLARSMATFQCARRAFETLGAEDGGRRRNNNNNSKSGEMIEKLNELRDESINLANKAEAAMWAVEEGFLKRGHLGNKFSGAAKWSNEVKERRTNAKSAFGFDNGNDDDDSDECCLFVDVLLRYLKEKSGNADVASYPFKSVPDALNAIWGGSGGDGSNCLLYTSPSPRDRG